MMKNMRNLSNELSPVFRSRVFAALLLLFSLFFLHFALHLLTPYDSLSSKLLTHEVITEESPFSVSTSPIGRRIASTKETCQSSCCPSLAPCTPSFQREHNYMFGYGSLINSKSRHMTHQTGRAVATTIKGFRRSWSYAQPERNMTALGVVADAVSSVNGVVVLVPADALPKFDEREKRYTRTLVPSQNVEIVQANGEPVVLGPNDKVWIYVVDTPTAPIEQLPIAQSYVDVVVSGCLEQSEAFAIECVRNTAQWQNPSFPNMPVWLNDREQPRIYTTTFLSQTRKDQVDRILQQAIPEAFKLRKDLKNWPTFS